MDALLITKIMQNKKCKYPLTVPDVNDIEVRILETLNYEFSFESIYSFIEMYTACFWTMASERLDLESEVFVKSAVGLCDLLHMSPSFLVKYKNPKLLACAVIACASEIKCGRKLAALHSWCKYEDEIIMCTSINEKCLTLQEKVMKILKISLKSFCKNY